MKLEVNATRMELLKLKKRLVLAKSGHKLLKDKQDELMRKFLDYVHINKALREKLDNKLMEVYSLYYESSMEYDGDKLKSMFLVSDTIINLEEKIVPVMNLRLPEYTSEIKGDFHSFGFKDVDIDIDVVLKKFQEVLPDIIELAQVENSVKELSEEIEKTRRRVNALEYILIPNLEETIRYISMKISENERSNLTRLMKVKEIVEQH